MFLLKAFFKCVCIQMLMKRYLFLEIREKRNRVPDTCYINNDRANVITFMYVSSNWHDAKNAEIQTTSFSKESVENADLYKPVLNKIMTTYE